MIQVRDVPEETHRVLKARAAREGMSLSDFIKRELAQSVSRPTMREWLEMVGKAKPMQPTRSPVEVIRELRDSR